MDNIDILFGAHLAASVGATAVAFAFHGSVCRFVRDGLFGRHYGDRLGAGIGVIAASSAIVNLIRLANLILGTSLLEDIIPAPIFIALGLGVGQIGYYLAYTAWLAATHQARMKRIALTWAAFIGAIAVVGAVAYPFIRP